MEVLDDMKKLMMIVVALIGALTGFADSAEMKLMSFNVLHCAGMDGKLDIGRAAAGIAEGCEGRPVREGDRGDGRSCPFHRGSVSREGGIRPSDRAGGHRGVGLDRNGALLCA